MGNIKQQDRWGGTLVTGMEGLEANFIDNLSYHYLPGTNQLNYIADGIGGPATVGDLTAQASGNYTYDQIGNLIGDVSEQNMTITWDACPEQPQRASRRVRGKVASVTKNGSFPRVDYYYDALGQRIAKTHKPTALEHTWVTTYYVRDAQGNTLAVYEHTTGMMPDANPVANANYAFTQTLKVKEYTLYGSARLGVHEVNQTISTRSFNAKYLSVSPLSAQLLTPTGSIPAPVYAGWATFAWPCTTSTSITPVTVTLKRYGLVRGQKKYELANHLGNVMAVITDRKVQDPTGGYLPCVASYSDYYPFGWEMPGRSSGAAYRYAFNGQEKDGETGFTEFEFRQYDGRVSRFLSLDPIAAQYPWNSPYAFAENRVIDGVDLEGKEYLSNWESRVKIAYGGCYLNIKNFTYLSRKTFENANNNNHNWNTDGVGEIGVTSKIFNLYATPQMKDAPMPTIAQSTEGQRLAPTTSTPSNKNMRKYSSDGNVIAKSTPTQAPYNASRTSVGQHAVKAGIFVDAIALGFELTLRYCQAEDYNLVISHIRYAKQAADDVNKYLSLVDSRNAQKYNYYDRIMIANVVLMGETGYNKNVESRTPDELNNLRNVGISIFQASASDRKPIEIESSVDGVPGTKIYQK